MTDNLQETFNNFATLAFEHLRKMDGPSVVRAINTISKELSIDEHTTQQFLTNITKYQEEAFYEQLHQKILLMYQETSSLQYPNFPLFKPPIQTPANSFGELKMKDPLPNIQVQNEIFQFHKTEPPIQQSDSILQKQLEFASTLFNQNEAKKNYEHVRKQIPLNGIRKRNLFRIALMKTFQVENVTDLELCELVKESKTSRWKQMSRYIQCMSTKQVSDYFWKTFMNGAKR
ncbi:Hypothetical_protein [Hexamita inflata]|uniref:Hypothetical_protein n=1 Tax=Hexamita inflata TaxID=28002 RepID=A0AA86QRW4_9EUKA|nr:Hypothetical protein HINF_LOCUS52504 [Hexamita inflata]